MIIVDNCSPNGDFKELSQKSGDFIFLASDQNRGYAAGNNIGLRYCIKNSYEYALILNNDILFSDKNLLCKLLNAIQKDRSIAAISPDIYSPQGYLYNRDAKRPSFFDLTLGLLAYRKKGRKIHDLGGYAYVYRPQGCCMLLDVRKVSDINLMDENTFLYSEEIILAERFLRKDFRCACCFETNVIHAHSTIVQKNIQKNKIKKIKLESFDYYLKEYRRFSKLKRGLCLLFYRLKLALQE